MKAPRTTRQKTSSGCRRRQARGTVISRLAGLKPNALLHHSPPAPSARISTVSAAATATSARGTPLRGSRQRPPSNVMVAPRRLLGTHEAPGTPRHGRAAGKRQPDRPDPGVWIGVAGWRGVVQPPQGGCMNSLVELGGVTKIYDGAGGSPALNGVSLRIPPGQVTAVMGP